MIQTHQIDPKYAFQSWEEMLALPKFCDCVIIATSDDDHFKPAKMALEKGYHLLLEKPMSNRLDESMQIAQIGRKNIIEKLSVACASLHALFFHD